MAIGRITGQMLNNNLDRLGVDLAFDANLVYLDVNSRRVGIATASPGYTLDVKGNAHLGNIYIIGNTITTEPSYKLNIGTITNVQITGGSANYIIATDGAGNLSFTNIGSLPDLVSANSAIATINANIGAYQIYANANAATQATSINTINANLGSYQTYANTQVNTINANLGAYESWANATFATSTSETVLSSNVGAYQIYANANIGTLYLGNISTQANLGAYQTYANANIGTLYLGNISTNANLGAYQTYANANAATQATSINTINANLGAYEIWANANFVTTATEYGNTQVAAYLPIYTGNLSPGNVTSTFYGNVNTNYILPSNGSVVTVTGTGALQVPVGTTAQQPVGKNGYIRFNSDNSTLEYFDGSVWASITNTVTDQQITPDGVLNTYTLNQSATTIGVIVSINGTLQRPNTSGDGAYTVSGNQITFTEVPQITDIIDIRFLGAAVTINNTLSDNLIVSGNLTLSGILQSPLTTKTSTSPGTAGQVCWDASYIYICTATNTWKRVALTGGVF